MGGPAMRAAKILASGDLQLIILALLSEKPRHGYEIIKAIEEHSSGIYTPSPGMVYPALTYLEEMGYAASEAKGTKKLYRITEAGAAHLKANRAGADETLDHLARFGRRIAEFQKRFRQEDEDLEDLAGAPGRHIKDDWRRARVEFRQVREELKAALYEKLDTSAEERERIIAVLRRAIGEIRGKSDKQ